MSKLEKLIQNYCPDGVEYVKLGDIMSISRGASPRPIQSYITSDESGIPWIKIGDASPESKYIFSTKERVTKEGASKSRYLKKGAFILSNSMSFGRPYILNLDGCIHDGWISMCDFKEHLNPDFLYYLLRSNVVQSFWVSKANSGGAVSNLNSDIVRSTPIPLPPFPVQKEIVRVLDVFTELLSELQSELIKRKEQYQHYQDLLLNKSHFSKHISIGELCDVKKGNTAIQKAKEGTYPLVVTTMERKSCDEYQFNANAVCIPLVSSRGHGIASLNHVYYQEGKFALGNILCAVIPSDETVLKAKFLYYYLEYAKDYILVPLMKGGANVSMHCSDIEKVKIPVPSIQEQERIVSVLDRFDTLTNNLTEGLPAEIEKRKQQYEYYRDKLLTFKHINNENI